MDGGFSTSSHSQRRIRRPSAGSSLTSFGASEKNATGRSWWDIRDEIEQRAYTFTIDPGDGA